MGKRLGAFACAPLLVSICVQDARADVPAVNFSVDPRAKDCPSAIEFRREVDRQIGNENAPSLEHGARVDVHIEVVEGGGLRARLDVDEPPSAGTGAGGAAASGHHRSQTLRAPAYACRDLSAAAAIAVSLVLRAVAGARAQPDAGEPNATDATQPGEPRAAEPPMPDSRPLPNASARPLPAARARSGHSRSVTHSLFAGALAGKTVVPGAGAGAIVGYSATWRERWGLAAEASALLPRIAIGARGAGVFVTSRTVSLAPCIHYGIGLACASASFGSIVGSGTRVRVPETQRFSQVELGLRIGARTPLAGPFALRTELRSGFPLVRSRFSIEGDTVWATPAVTVTLSASLETIF
jgi:hypothetical protein